jgi:hypothetical protein
VDPSAADHRWVDQERDAQRVVDRRRASAVHRLEVVVGRDPALDDRGGGLARLRPRRSQPVAIGGRHERLVGRIERHQGELGQARRQDDPRSVRVHPDVELGRWRGVARRVGATHDHRLGDALDEPWLELDRQGDVRERSHRHERDRVRGGHVGVDQEIDRMSALFRRAGRRDRQLAGVHAAAPMEHLAGDREVVAQEGRSGTLIHRDVDAEQVEHAQRVVGAVRDRVVAVDGRRSDQLEVGVERGQHQRDRVVGARVDVEDQLPWGGHGGLPRP